MSSFVASGVCPLRQEWEFCRPLSALCRVLHTCCLFFLWVARTRSATRRGRLDFEGIVAKWLVHPYRLDTK